MIAFPCAHCGKGLKASPAQAGKILRCPKCGRPTAVPVPGRTPAAGPAAEAKTFLPQDELPPSLHASRTLPPSDPLKATTTTGDEKIDRTQLIAGYARGELIDFLGPPQAAEEIGRLGNYRILKILGAGGMGVVFQAEDLRLKRPVALKAMLPSLAVSGTARKRFLREAQTAASIKHHHIVTIHQVDEDRGAPFLAMEFLEGESLDARLKRQGKLPLLDVLRIAREIAEGLEAAHARGLIHRDIKPANIWLEAPQAHVKVLDFGLARVLTDESKLTQTGAILGTPAYMAPEQANSQPVDQRCDLFSLGCVLYQMGTGQQPFRGPDTVSLLIAVSTEQPRPPRELNPKLPPALADLVLRLLAKKAQDRPPTARAVAVALAQMQERAAPRVRKRWLLAAGAGALLSLAAMFFLLQPAAGPTTGTLVIDVDDPKVEIRIKQNDTVLQERTTQRNFTLPGGDGMLEVFDKDGWPLCAEKFTLPRGGVEAVKVRLDHARLARPVLTFDLGGHRHVIHKVLFTPDGKQLLTGSLDGNLRLWDLSKDKGKVASRVLHLPVFANGQIAMSGDGKKLAVAGRYAEREGAAYVVYLLTLADGRIERVLRGPTDTIRALVFSADGQRLAAGGDDKTVRVWDLSSTEAPQVLPAPNPVSALAFAPDGQRLAQFHHNSYVSLITELSSGKVVASLEGGKVPSYWGLDLLSWSPDGQVIAICASDGVRLWGSEGKLRHHLLQKQPCGAVAFSADSRWLLAAARVGENRVHLFDVQTGMEKLTFAPKVSHSSMASAFAPDGKSAATATEWGGVHALYLWNTTTGGVIKRLSPPSSLVGPNIRAGWSADGKSVAWRQVENLESWKGPAGSFDLEKLQLGPPLEPSQFRGATLQQGPLALKHIDDQLVHVLRNGKTIADLKYPNWRQTLLGPDQAALGGGTPRIGLFDTSSGKLLRELSPGTSTFSLAAAPDARHLLVHSMDQALRLFDPSAESPLRWTLYVAGKDWVLWSWGGYYAASPGGEKLLRWKLDNGIDKEPSVFPVEQYRAQFYRPDLLKLLPEKSSFEEALAAANAARPKE